MARLIIAEVLKRKKITKYRLAQLLGKPPSSVHRFFRPDFNPTFSLLCAIAQALGVKVRDLIRED